MPNAIKYKSGSLAGSISTGNVALGVNESVIGPTSETGWYSGLTPPGLQYVIYEVNESEVPKIYSPNNDTEFIQFARSKGATGANTGSVASVLNWATSQADIMIVNKAYPSIITDELAINVDAGFTPSYPTTSSTWYDLSGNNALGSLFNFTYDDNSIGLSTTSSTIVIQNNIPAISSLDLNEFSIEFTTKLKQAFDSISIITSPTSTSYSQPTQSAAKYNNVVCTFSQSGNSLTQVAYLNGNEIINNISTNPSFSFGTAYNIGVNTNNNSGTSKIGYIQTYNKVLTPAEVLQNYYQAPIVTDGLVLAVDAGNLVSYESGSTTTYSLTGSSSGSLVNGVGYSNGNGGNWDLDGSDDYINIPYSGSTSGSFTFTIAMKCDTMDLNTSNRQTLFGLSQNGNAAFRLFDLEIFGNTGRGFRGNGGSVENVDFFGYSWSLNEDANSNNIYTVTLNATGQSVYLNGQLRSIINQAYTASFNSVVLGTRLAGNLWNGQCYYFSIYNRELSATEISQNYQAQRSRFGL
jgi:hypothetical protein